MDVVRKYFYLYIRFEQVLKIEYKENVCYRSKNGLPVGILQE